MVWGLHWGPLILGKLPDLEDGSEGMSGTGFDGWIQACGVKPDLIFGILFLRKREREREREIYIYTYRAYIGVDRDTGKENGSYYLGYRV